MWTSFILFVLATLANAHAIDPSNDGMMERIQVIAFVIDNHGNSTTTSASEVSGCADHFLSKIASGDLAVKESVAVDGSEVLTQSHNVVQHMDEGEVGCTMLWSLSTKLKGMHIKEGTLAATNLRKRSILDETQRQKRSPLLGGLLGSIFGGGDNSGSDNSGGDNSGGDSSGGDSGSDGGDTQSRKKRSPQGISIELDINDGKAAPPPPPPS